MLHYPWPYQFINSIANKLDQLDSLVDRNIDVLVITETKLDESYPTAQLLIRGYSEPFRSNRNRHGGGILIYIREDIPSKELTTKHKFPDDIEGIFVEMNLRKTKWLLFGTYHPPSQVLDYYMNYLERSVDIYSEFYDNFLLLGDFNCEETEPLLSSFLHQYEANSLVKEPTCFKNPDNPSCIDLLITNRCHSFQNTMTVATGLSDFHKMVVTVLKTTFTKTKAKEIMYRDYRKFDKDNFKKSLKESIAASSVFSYKEFETIFLKTLNKYAPLKKKKIRANQVPYMTKALRKAIMKRSELESKYLKLKSPSSRIRYKKQKNFVSKFYKKLRKKYYSNLDLKKITDNKQFWQYIGPFFSEKVKTKQQITLVEKGEILSEDVEVAKTLNSFFENAVKTLDISENTPLLNISSEKIDDPIDRLLEKFASHPSILKIRKMVTDEHFSFSEVDLVDVEKELLQLNAKKAHTQNDIPTKPLKETTDVCGPVLHYLVNQSFSNSDFPSELKLADITPTFKKGDKTCAENYRPISVLPVVSKIYERLMQSQIIGFINKRLSPYLCGYRKGFNTQHALLSLVERWKRTLDKHGYAAAILMDLSKAFDTLNHELLLAKLHAYGFSKAAIKLIHSYLKNRWQRTKINNSYSSWKELLSGVPQGSVLGPLLFNIYLNDLFWEISLTDTCNYADDTTIYACDQELETVLNCLEHDTLIAIEWFDNNYMKLNSDKCHLLISGFKHQCHWIKVGDHKVWESAQEKLLGLKIDNMLSFEPHVTGICKKANRKLSALARISKFLPLHKRKLLFNTFVQSQFAYCPLIWMFHDRSVNNKINRLHERALRIIYKDDQSSFEELLKKDNGFTVHEKNLQTLAIEVYKTKHHLSNDLIGEFFTKRVYNRAPLRTQSEYVVPRVNSVHNGDDSIRHLGPLIWEMVPRRLKISPNLSHFKEEIRKWRPMSCPCRLCKPFLQGVGYLC